jgi:hypothetical protein
MRAVHAVMAVAVLWAAAAILQAAPANAVCSVFDQHPCMPTVCSVFRRGPCIPEIDYPIGQDLRLTIESAAVDQHPASAGERHDTEARDHKLDTLRDMFGALRACWVPPAQEDARAGMQMSVRFAFNVTGGIIATPRVTYSSPNASREARKTYHDTITAALVRCTPLPLSERLGGAVAGRPLAIRFVENRNLEGTAERP